MSSRVRQFFEKLYTRFQRMTEPTESITDPNHRQLMRLINSIAVVFIPMAVCAGIIHYIIDPSPEPITQNLNFITIIVSVILLLFTSFFSRYVGYKGAIAYIFVAGYIIVMFNVLVDMPEYFNIVYMVILTIIGVMIFSTRASILIAVLELVTVVMLSASIPTHTLANVLVFLFVTNFIILFGNYYRNRLEHDRNQQLTDSEAFLRLITDQLPVSVWITDKKLMRRATFGQVQDVQQIDTIPMPKSINAYRQALEGHSAQFEDHRGNRRLQYHVEPMRDVNGDIIGTLGVATDITEQHLLQQQTLQLELERERVEILSKFIEHSSHDLRTPLSNINTYLYLLDNSIQTDKQHNYIEVIREQSQRLQGLIDNMLTLQRLELETRQEFRRIAIKGLLDNVEISYRERIEASNIQFDYQSPDESIFVNVTEKHVFIALSKIVDNAIQFTPSGGTIRLETSKTADTVQICISDTGIGIPADQLPHIFEVFYRGDDSRPATSGDNGLGLTIAERIIKAHRGQVTVDSTVNEGTTFHITLPLASL